MKINKLVLIVFLILSLFSCKKSSTSSDPISISFNDTNLEQLIRDELDMPTGDILKSDLETITELVGVNLGIADLTGLEYCINLIYLDLMHNNISEIDALLDNEGFDTDDFIDLQDNPLSSQATDTDIPQLRGRGVYVYIDETETIVNIPNANFETILREALQKPAGDLTSNELATIDRINVNYADISNLSGIEYCKNITYINFYNSNITDISRFEGLRKLKDLYLARNSVQSISALKNMNQLQSLGVSGNSITDISQLLTLPSLTFLSVGDNPITDLSVINQLTQLTYVSIVSMLLPDLSIIDQLVNLTSLEARYNKISDISALANLTNLTRIAINGNDITDISVLSSLPELKDIDFGDNQISDISIITNLPNLTSVGIYSNHTLDISIFANSDIDLERLYIQDCQISDIKPFVDNPNFDTDDQIWLQNNPLSDLSKNTYIPQLEARGVIVMQ